MAGIRGLRAMLVIVSIFGTLSAVTARCDPYVTTIAVMKQGVAAVLGVRPCQLVLTYQGAMLTRDEFTLAQYGILRDPTQLMVTVTIFVP